MKFKLLLSIGCLVLLFSQKTAAQCAWRLDMFDDGGDGWNGGALSIESGNSKYTFTLTDALDDGKDSTVFFTVEDTKPLKINWLAGAFTSEVTFRIYDYEGDLVVEKTAPFPGLVFDGTGYCPSCLDPEHFRVDNLWDNRVRLRWNPISSATPLGWWVIAGPQGFTPGPGVGDTIFVTQPRATVIGLTEMTAYDVWLRQDCGGGDTSRLVGPLSFKTYWSDDVGISGIVLPTSGCNLGQEKVEVLIKNSGANPQSLVPFFYSVDGVAAPVPFPEDGLYTAVLGKDSCEFIAFETAFDFSQPGEYLIAAWTAHEMDDNPSNDTFYYRVTNRLRVPYRQDFEIWHGDWHLVDSLNSASSWALGPPEATLINSAASGANAWVTNLYGPHNDSEQSFLTSPCFDFSNLTNDPVIEFSMFYDLETDVDACHLELSKDGGETWQKLGKQGEGFHWYNNQNLGDVWSGLSGRWLTARHDLDDVAGIQGVRLRFAFEADETESREGVAVDNIQIYEPRPLDLFADIASANGSANECGFEKDSVHFTFANFGTATATTWSVAYSINGGAPVIESVLQSLPPYATTTYTFQKPFDSRDGLFDVRCWLRLPGDANVKNDTVRFQLDHRPQAVPLFEDFENQEIPSGWAATSPALVTDGHNNKSYVLSYNLFINGPEFVFDLPRYGMISTGDSLAFDYRITDYSSGTVATDLNNGSEITIQGTTDCGATWSQLFTIDKNTHTPSVDMKNLRFDLSQFAGKAVRIQFKGTWSSGDFFFDLDNVNIRACPADLQLSADVTPATAGQTDGEATVHVGHGNPPFSYEWSTGDSTQTVDNLEIGDYFVTVTDSRGCSGLLVVTVGNSAVNDIEGLRRIALQPNPSTGLTTLRLELENPADLQVRVFDLLGRVLRDASEPNASTLNLPLDLRGQTEGLYLVRVQIGAGSRVLKLVLVR